MINFFVYINILTWTFISLLNYFYKLKGIMVSCYILFFFVILLNFKYTRKDRKALNAINSIRSESDDRKE